MGDQIRFVEGKLRKFRRIFSNRDSVQAFVTQHGKEVLRRQYDDQLFHTEDYPLVQAWLAEDKQRELVEAAAKTTEVESERLELERRNTAAAERSAEAAKQSAKWAGWALAISLLAIVVSVATLLYART